MFVCIPIPPMRARYLPISLSSYDPKNDISFYSQVLTVVTPNASSGVWSRVFCYICTDVSAAIALASQKVTQANIPGITLFESRGGLFCLNLDSHNNLHTNGRVIFPNKLRLASTPLNSHNSWLCAHIIHQSALFRISLYYTYTYINKSPTCCKLCRPIYFIAESLCMFRVSQHPSSGVLKTVTAASGTGHNVARSGPGRDLATLEGSSCTDIMTCTGGCGYSF